MSVFLAQVIVVWVVLVVVITVAYGITEKSKILYDVFTAWALLIVYCTVLYGIAVIVTYLVGSAIATLFAGC